MIQITFDWLEKKGYPGVTDYCRDLVYDGNYDGEVIEVYRRDRLCLIVKDVYKASTVMAKDCKWIKYDRTRRKGSQEPRRAI